MFKTTTGLPPQEEAFGQILHERSRKGIRTSIAQLLDRFIFWALLVLIAFAVVPYGTVEPWSVALFESAAFILGALWMIEGFLSGSWLKRGHRLVLPLLALTLLAMVQTLPLLQATPHATGIESARLLAISDDPYETRLFALKCLALAICLSLLIRYTSTRFRLRSLINFVIGIGVASALFSILRQTLQHGKGGFVLPYLLPNTGYGLFINKNHFAFLMEMVFGLVLGLIFGGGIKRERILIYIAMIAPIWMALVLSSSRGGIFSMLCQVFFAGLLLTMMLPTQFTAPQSKLMSRLWRLANSLFFRFLLIAGLVTALVVCVIWVGGDQLTTKFEAAKDESTGEVSNPREGARRMDIWAATWQSIKANPITGIGFGGYWVTVVKYHNASGEVTPQQAHNDYLEVLASGGLFGALLLCWFLFLLITAARKRLQLNDSFRRAACAGALVGLFGVAVHSFVEFGLHITINSLICLALIVIATAEIEAEEVSLPRNTSLINKTDPAKYLPEVA
ncbi:MAG: O-antigen ligase family protein [Pyrinomonadaceae bacterium]